jgi:hypothetical protein
VEAVAGRNDYAMEVVVGGGFGCAVVMAVAEVVLGEGFGYAVVMVVVVVEVGYAVELHALAGGGCLGCIATM